MHRTLLPFLVYLLVAITVTWSAFVGVGEVVPGDVRTDVWNSLWSLDVVATAMEEGRLPFETQSINFPDGGVFVVSDPLGALLATPIVWMRGLNTGFSWLVWFQLAFGGTMMHRFATEYLSWRRGSGSTRLAPWLSGMSFTIAPLMMSHVQNGATEALSGGWTVLAVWMCWRASVRGSIFSAVVAAFCLFLASVGHWYGGVVAFLFAGSLLVMGNGEGRLHHIHARALSLLLGMAFVLPLAWAVQNLATDADSLLVIKNAEILESMRRTLGPADPLGYLVPGEFRSPDFYEISRNDERFVHSHYLGWSLIGLSVWGVVRRRRATGFLVLSAIVCGVLSLGPVLVSGGSPVVFAGSLVVPLPFFLVESMPGFSSLSLLYRLALGPVIALCLLAGMAIDQRGKRMLIGALALVWIELRWLSPVASLPTTVNVVPYTSLVALADAPDGAVMNYPLQPGRAYLYEQTIHRKPVAGSLNKVTNRQSERLWKRIMAEMNQSPDAFHRAVSTTAERLGIRYLVVHTDPYAEPDTYTEAVRRLERLFPPDDWGQGQVRVLKLW
ncbi:MAG: hypothetical protein CL930_14930 [Deltaproteobacteria bacterium]|nr:hypothetical protein [Deltaproteobacteria bacterium]